MSLRVTAAFPQLRQPLLSSEAERALGLISAHLRTGERKKRRRRRRRRGGEKKKQDVQSRAEQEFTKQKKSSEGEQGG